MGTEPPSNPSVNLGSDLTSEIDGSRGNTYRSEWVREPCKLRLDAEEAGVWELLNDLDDLRQLLEWRRSHEELTRGEATVDV